MQVTYAGQIIATERSEGGLDAVQDFILGGGKQAVQWSEPPRATDAVPYPRGNRKRQVTGTVILSSQPDLETAMVLRGTFYDGLPPSGALITRVGGRMLTSVNAVLESCEVLKDQQGVSVGFKFTFLPSGPATPGTYIAPVLNNDGTEVLNNDGTQVLNNPSS